ncbi:hypothetical protein ACHAW6_010398 [Cyclotella cf. meneghiniana]
MSAPRRPPESPMRWRGERTVRSMSPSSKVTNFDRLLQKMETEQKHLTINTGTWTRSAGSSPAKYDFAQRAKELRMSIDRTPSFVAASPNKIISLRSVGGAPIRTPSPIGSRNSFGHNSDRISAGYRNDSSPVLRSPPSFASPYLNGTRGKQSTSDGTTTPIRSAAALAPSHLDEPTTTPGTATVASSNASFPSPRLDDAFHDRVEQFQKNLVFAHDTIAALQRDVRDLERKLAERDESAAVLERRNAALADAVDAREKEIGRLKKEIGSMEETKEESVRKNAQEMAEMKAELDGYRRQSTTIDRLAKEYEETTEAWNKSKRILEDTIRDKDQMIGSLRKEIRRLDEELADGAYVRAQAKKAEERAAELEAELQTTRGKLDAASRTVAELKVKNEKLVDDKEKEQADLENSKESSYLQRANRLKEKATKLEAELDKANAEKDELHDQLKILNKRLGRDEKIAARKDEEIKKLEAELLEAEAREKELKTQLDKSHQELKSQRARFEEYSNECAMEQETIAALEQAIGQLEEAQNEMNAENLRLQQENSKLSRTVEDAELCVQNEIEHATRLKQMLDELAEINHDLGEQLRSKEDSLLTMKTTEQHLSTLLQSSHERNDRLEAQRDTKNESSHHFQELERKLEEKQQLVLSLQNQFDALKIDHKTATVELQRLRDEYSTHAETKRKLDELTLLVGAKESEFDELKENREKMLVVISTLERELEQLRKERKILASKLSNLEKTETDADEARETVSSLEIKVKDLQVQLDKAHENSRDANEKLREQETIVSQLEEALEKAQQDSDAAWMHAREVEGLSQVGKCMENSIKAKLARVEKKLATRDEQLVESRKGIAEAQKMIYRLMETVKVLRKREKDQELDLSSLDFVVASE